MKDRYLLVIGFIICLMLFAFSMASAKTRVEADEGNVNLLDTKSMSYGACVRLDKSILNGCIDEIDLKLELCNSEAEDAGLNLEVCRESYKSNKKSCKNSFKSIKDVCALNRKTLIQRLKERF